LKNDSDVSDDQIVVKLVHEFPNAPYFFLKIKNYSSAETDFFVKGEQYNPYFEHGPLMDGEFLEVLLKRIRDRISQIRNDNITGYFSGSFLTKRLKEAELLQAYQSLMLDPGSTYDQDRVDYLHEMLRELYGWPDEKVFWGIINKGLSYARLNAGDRSGVSTDFASEIISLLRMQPREDYVLNSPSYATFIHYRGVYEDYYAGILDLIERTHPGPYSADELGKTFMDATSIIGADGWVVKTMDSMPHIQVSYRSKTIYIGKLTRIRTKKKLEQIVMHEIAGHVYRSMGKTEADQYRERYMSAHYTEHEEGFCTVLEQLSLQKFYFKRTYRYLAICLALGLDGKARDFLQTYHILWRYIALFDGDIARSKKRAFKEAARVFRCGVTTIPAVIYNKDQCYLTGNQKIWHYLSSNQLNVAEFDVFARGGRVNYE
jgi:hypothetical protein